MRRGQRGQAAVETVALMPIVALVALVLMQVLAAGITRAYAGHAAGQGAVAIAEGDDPKDAVRDALPGWSRHRLSVEVHRTVVTVRVTPVSIVPGLAGHLVSTAHADAVKTP